MREGILHSTLAYTLASGGLLPVFYCAVRFHKWPLFAWLESRPARGMGKISYTFYLSHFGFLHLAGYAFQSRAAIITSALLATLAFSTASYFLMEKPLNEKRNRNPGPRAVIHRAGGKLA
jgi:peptidoglycan/LPS O-acetylase OafA/YrhL